MQLVKTYASLLKPYGAQDEILFLDGTYPSEAGYVVMQKTLSPGLANLRHD